MVRASKTASASVVSADVSVPAVSNIEKAPRVKKTKDVVAPVVDTPVLKVVVDTPVTDVVVDHSNEGVVERLAEYGRLVFANLASATQLKNEFKTMEKAVLRELKNAQKKASNRKRTSGNRQPSGFIKPTLISDELAVFLGKPTGTELARTAVSKEINSYIRANNLQDPANGRKIHPDVKLSKLLKIAKGDELTYFNLQRYMKHHFVKAVAPTVVA
jgi:chromatin remodeling complex protein RSC6